MFCKINTFILFILFAMIVLGIDPGVRKMGYALVQTSWSVLKIIDAGVIIDSDQHHIIDRQRYYHRIGEIYDFIVELVTRHHISKMAIEKLFFTLHNQNNAEFVYAVRWLVCMIAHRHWIQILEPTPIQLKKAITGNAKASKEFMIQMIMRLYHLTETPEYHDSADALALALYAHRISIPLTF